MAKDKENNGNVIPKGFIDELYKAFYTNFKQVCSTEEVEDFKYAVNSLGFKSEKAFVVFLLEEQLNKVTNPQSLAEYNIDGFAMIKSINKRDGKVAETYDEERIKKSLIKFHKSINLFVLDMMEKDGADKKEADDYVNSLKRNLDNFTTKFSYLNEIPQDKINEIVKSALGDIDALKDSMLFKTQLKPDTVVKNKDYFVWDNDEAQLQRLFKILREGLNPFIEDDYDGFLSLFIVSGVKRPMAKLKWTYIPKNPKDKNYRQMGLLFHSLHEKGYIISDDKKINSTIANRLLDYDGKSIPLDNFKKSYSGLSNSKDKSDGIIAIEKAIDHFIKGA